MLNNQALFADRKDAGKRLAEKLKEKKYKKTIIIALPRGGVPVGYEVAKALNAPLDVIIARKLGAPGYEEYGVGAISEDDIIVLDIFALATMAITKDELNQILDKETKELHRRVEKYRDNNDLNLKGKTVILVDDGIATGVTATAAINSIKEHNPAKVILAVPVCAPDFAKRLKATVDEFVCLKTPEDFAAVAECYSTFPQIRDSEVLEILQRRKLEHA